MSDDRDWRPLSTAPHDGQDVELLLSGGATTVGFWERETRCCMLGSRTGSLPDGWTDTKERLPLGDEGPEVFAWRPLEAAHSVTDLRPASTGGGPETGNGAGSR